MADNSLIGQRLRQLRGARSLIAWAAMIGSNKTSWAEYEAGKTPPALDLLIRVKEITGCDLNWLATGDVPAPGALDTDVLRDVIQAIEEETPGIDPQSKAKLISRLYSDRIKVHSIGIEAHSLPRRNRASKS